MSAPTMTSEDVQKAFDDWWGLYGYEPPSAPHDSPDWDHYHARMGLAWSAFQAGLRFAIAGTP